MKMTRLLDSGFYGGECKCRENVSSGLIWCHYESFGPCCFAAERVGVPERVGEAKSPLAQ